jgi:autotransporter-associated beta strand protein
MPEFLPEGDGNWNSDINWSADSYPDGAAAEAYIGPPRIGDRTVGISAAVSIARLVVDNADSAFRNRIAAGGAGVGLSFAGPAPRLEILGDGPGFVEFVSDHAGTLAADLTISVDNLNLKHGVEGVYDDDYGALRLRDNWEGPGGLIKEGPGVMSLTGSGKDYTGATVVRQGVLRLTESSAPAYSSAIRVEPGGQLRLVSEGPARVYSFGAPLQLDSMGRGGGVPEGEQLGVLGALRMDPGSNGNRASVPSDVVLAGDSDIHVDGSANVLELTGALSGAGALVKSGGGTLVLSADSVGYTAAVTVATGALLVDGTIGANVELAEAALLGGSGNLGAISGAGTVAPEGGAVLTGESLAGQSLRFSLQAGAPGATLRLRGETPFAAPLGADRSIDFFLPAPPAAGDCYEGGIFTDSAADFAAALAAAQLRVFVRDALGAVLHQGQTYSAYDGAIGYELQSIPMTRSFDGQTVDGRATRLLFEMTFEDWRRQQFSPDELEQIALSGALADAGQSGMNNLMRYALGLGRDEEIAGRIPRIDAASSGLRFRHHRLINPGPGIEYLLQYREGLAVGESWRSAELGVEIILEEVRDSGDELSEEVEYSIPAGLTAPEAFYRLRVRMND